MSRGFEVSNVTSKRRADGAVPRLAATRWALMAAATAMLFAAAALADRGRFVVVSDIHAFACRDQGPCSGSAKTCADPSKSVSLACEPSHVDTDGCLFGSFLEDLACQQQGRTDFVLIPGDWIAHEYGGSAGDVELKRGIVTTLTERLAAQLPDALMIPALGNNDAYLGDYNLAPCLETDAGHCTGETGRFLRDTLALWRPLLEKANEVGTACLARPEAGRDYLEESFIQGGYYAVANPHLANNCTLVLNTVLLLEKYIGGKADDGVVAHGAAAAEAQLEWLRARLAFARRPPDGSPPRRVWLIYHVPPGANAYSSSAVQSASMMFSVDPAHDFADRFVALMAEYSDVIEAAFGGHTHLDSFRVLPAAKRDRAPGASFVHIAPSLTPSHHKDHGAYQWFTYRRADGETRIENVFTRRLALRRGSSWQQEYAWSQTYCHPCDYDAASLTKVFRSLRDPKVRSHAHDKHYYTRYYAEGDYTSIGDDDVWPWYVCAIGALTPGSYRDCVAAVRAEQRGTPTSSPAEGGETRGHDQP